MIPHRFTKKIKYFYNTPNHSTAWSLGVTWNSAWGNLGVSRVILGSAGVSMGSAWVILGSARVSRGQHG